MNKQLSFDDVSLIPKKCIVESRSNCHTNIKFGKFEFDIPVLPANMKSVINEETCEFLSENNCFYIMHRFDNVDLFSFSKKMNNKGYPVSISVGINDKWGLIVHKLSEYKINIDYITIDVANAWSHTCKKMAEICKHMFPKAFLIVGNVATSEAVKDIQDWGVVDCIKVGIAPGKVCTTRNKTGFYRPQISAIDDCSSVSKLPIIADGGIVEHGDIAKAIAFGADMVMAGSLFAGYDESAGNLVEPLDDKKYKEYYGSASEYNKEEKKNIEGKKILIPYRGKMKNLLKEIKEDLQSSISYSGGFEIKDLKRCEYYII